MLLNLILFRSMPSDYHEDVYGGSTIGGTIFIIILFIVWMIYKANSEEKDDYNVYITQEHPDIRDRKEREQARQDQEDLDLSMALYEYW